MSAPDTSPDKSISRNISPRWRGVALIWAVVYFLLVTGLASYAYRYPDNAWDMLGYMGVIASWRTTDATSIHEEAYSAIHSKPKYAALAGNDATSEFHRDVAHDSVHFVQQLPFYSVKPLYCIAAAGLHRAGFSLPGSLLMISLFSFICYALLAWVWLRKYLMDPWCTIFSGLLILTPPLFHLGRIGTPDALELLLLVSGLYLMLEHSKAAAGCTLFLVAIWVRPDAIVFVGLLCCVLFFFADHRCHRMGHVLRFSADKLWPHRSVCTPVSLGRVISEQFHRHSASARRSSGAYNTAHLRLHHGAQRVGAREELFDHFNVLLSLDCQSAAAPACLPFNYSDGSNRRDSPFPSVSVARDPLLCTDLRISFRSRLCWHVPLTSSNDLTISLQGLQATLKVITLSTGEVGGLDTCGRPADMHFDRRKR
jgi:hypothetical protein